MQQYVNLNLIAIGLISTFALLLLISYIQSRYGRLSGDPYERKKISPLVKFILNTPLRHLWVPLRWLYIRHIHTWIRVLFVRPELSVAVFGIMPSIVLIGYWITEGTEPNPLVLATTFYASVIFFKEIFLSDYPLLEIYPYKESGLSGFRLSYKTLNSGNKAASDVTFTYRVYDRHGRWLQGPEKPEEDNDHNPISLEPSEVSDKQRPDLGKSLGFKPQEAGWNNIEEDTPTPIFIELSASPNIGHRFLDGKEILRIDPRDS